MVYNRFIKNRKNKLTKKCIQKKHFFKFSQQVKTCERVCGRC